MLGLLKGLHATIGHLLTRKVTVQYPEQRHELPERSRGLIRLRLKENAVDPRCIACTFCERICPSVAIKIKSVDRQGEKVWSLDAGAGPMLSYFNRGERPLGLDNWPDKAGPPAPDRSGCLACSLLDTGGLSAEVLAKTASRNGVWLSQVFGVATFYDELKPGAPAQLEPAEAQAVHSAVVAGTTSVLLEPMGGIDPASIDSYAKAGGYEAVTRILSETSPKEVVDEISVSGLRGRGGAGYGTGRKWQAAAEAEGFEKYVVCNAEEGDLGSAKDSFILENSPHSVIEGMIVAGYAIGASKGIVYISNDKQQAIARVREAVEQAEDKGFLGEEIPGTGFSFEIEIYSVPASYVGGEETVVLNTLEGQRPMPGVRPPYPSRQGFRGMPTIVENVETLATVPWIMSKGARAFQGIGAEHAPGTRLFNVTGAVAQPGIYEAPLDITVKQLADAAGGFTGEVKAVLAGSTGGGFLSPGLFDIPLDFDSIAETGGDISSGVIRVLAGDDCLVDVVRQCIAFSASESCGKCVPCRMGTWRMRGIFDRICSGDGSEDDLALAEDLAQDIADGALCGLGRGSVKPLLTGLKFYRQDFVDHIGRDGTCAAGKCVMK